MADKLCPLAPVRQEISYYLTSRRFIKMGRFEIWLKSGWKPKVIYLEDVLFFPNWWGGFTSVNASPIHAIRNHSVYVRVWRIAKVVLSHAICWAMIAQLSSRVSFNRQDIVFNFLPMFHSFGLTGGTLLPLLSGVKTFMYPIPSSCAELCAWIGLCNQCNHHVWNWYFSVGLCADECLWFFMVSDIFLPEQKSQRQLRKNMDRFGVRILEGYGATETSPCYCGQFTHMHLKDGTVGRVLSGMMVGLILFPALRLADDYLSRTQCDVGLL